MSEYILETKDIVKQFGGIKALDGISIKVKTGEVHAIVGENGAGKSTLIKVLTGAHEPTSGTVIFDGKEYTSFTPEESAELGIAAIYQELNLIPYLSIAENMFFGREISNGPFCDYKKMQEETKKHFYDIGLEVDPRMQVKNLGIAQQQMVEIVKVVSKKAKLIIMDEPTAPLTDNETKELYEIIRELKSRGVTIIYISHRLEEIFEVCDRVTVFRDGKYVSTNNVSEMTRDKLITAMVGRELGEDYPKRTTEIGEACLEVKNLNNKKLHDVSITLHKNEILGLGGLMGAGRTEFARAVFGADPIDSGTIIANGKEVVIKNPEAAFKNKIAMLPEDRKGQGVFLKLPIKNNITISILDKLSRLGFVNKKKEDQVCEDMKGNLSIKLASMLQPVKALSGGNQQKVVFSKLLATESDILIVDEPTRGIDVGAKQEIYKLMRELTEKGKSIIMISSEMPELIGMSDRIVVMREGHVAKELLPDEFSQETILKYASL